MNPQKLAGQCAKLKCCLNFEVDTYMEASRRLPSSDIPLETKDATYYHFKTDTLAALMTYSTDKRAPVNCVTLPAARVAEIIAINKRGEKVDALVDALEEKETPKEFVELVGQDNINRFDKAKKKKKKRPAQQAGKAPQPAPSKDARQPKTSSPGQKKNRNDKSLPDNRAQHDAKPQRQPNDKRKHRPQQAPKNKQSKPGSDAPAQ